MANLEKRFDAVFEGGGVRGVGLVGALTRLERDGYQVVNIAGASAGAIVGALYAAGYRAAELKGLIDSVDFKQLEDRSRLGRIPVAGPVLNLFNHLGLYEGEVLLELLRTWLARKGKATFGDLVMPEFANDPRYRYRLKVVASDLSRGKLIVLPDDARDYGIEPDALEIALAVRMSMSIPFFFEPIVRADAQGRRCVIVDGGLLSNFPVEIFDSPTVPEWPTFGFHLAPGGVADARHEIDGPISMLRAMIETLLTAHDSRYLETHKFVRTIIIDTLGISPVDFALDAGRKQALFDAGIRAAEDFLAHWDFEAYKRIYRTGQPPARRRKRALPVV